MIKEFQDPLNRVGPPPWQPNIGQVTRKWTEEHNGVTCYNVEHIRDGKEIWSYWYLPEWEEYYDHAGT